MILLYRKDTEKVRKNNIYGCFSNLEEWGIYTNEAIRIASFVHHRVYLFIPKPGGPACRNIDSYVLHREYL